MELLAVVGTVVDAVVASSASVVGLASLGERDSTLFLQKNKHHIF